MACTGQNNLYLYRFFLSDSEKKINLKEYNYFFSYFRYRALIKEVGRPHSRIELVCYYIS